VRRQEAFRGLKFILRDYHTGPLSIGPEKEALFEGEGDNGVRFEIRNSHIAGAQRCTTATRTVREGGEIDYDAT